VSTPKPRFSRRMELVDMRDLRQIRSSAFPSGESCPSFWCERNQSFCFFVVESAKRWREIGRERFPECVVLTEFRRSSSAENFGDWCFKSCHSLRAISFEDFSKLKEIAAATEEIAGSACGDRRVGIGNRNSAVLANLVFTSDWTQIASSLAEGVKFGCQ
jgi:hypothetical protein